MITVTCDKCYTEFDTVLAVESIKIDGETYHVCEDCLRKWLGEEKV